MFVLVLYNSADEMYVVGPYVDADRAEQDGVRAINDVVNFTVCNVNPPEGESFHVKES